MKKTKTTKSALISAVLSLFLCFAMLLGTTFAWFTDSVTSAGNKIYSGTLEVDLELYDPDAGEWNSIKESNAPIFDYTRWEPGYMAVRLLKVENEGTLALKWKAKFVSNAELSILADVIDVYVRPSATEFAYPADRDLSEYTKVGTVAEFINSIETTTTGELREGEEAYLGIALVMRETAGNEYQGLDLGGVFDIQILATQLNSEEDSFDSDYDADADLDWTPVSSEAQMTAALASGAENIVLTDDIMVTEPFTVNYDANIDGQGYTLGRPMVATYSGETTVYTGVLFNVTAGQTLSLSNVIIDGGAVWTGEINPVLERGTVNVGVTATGALVSTEANATVILNEGAILRNNDGANAVNLGTRIGATLILNGGEIVDNHSAAGAIWGGGAIIINSGKVNRNHGGIGGAIRAVTNIGTLLTMNGGEMNHNYSDGNGGAIWAGSSRSNNVYVLNGGEMAYNYSATTGGAIYAGHYETVKIGGTFEMHDNDCEADIGSAIRFHDHASLVMTGGKVYNHDDNAFFLNNNSASITGGMIEGNFGYSGGLGLTMGNAEIDGVINYSLDTNHNTAYLAKEFGSFKFTVNETAANFAYFNFKPAADYVYTEGDEEKLICMNEGYVTYWDEATGTFKLQAQ